MKPVRTEPPELLVVVDAEEEFDWTQPFSRANRAVKSVPAQAAAHEIYDRFGIVPTYVVDYPVATDPGGAAFLRGLKEAGKAEIGAHLHPWVTPPDEEAVNARNSFHCNLSPELERAKIETITDAIAAAFGERPLIFKAGRYGFGPNTRRVLAELGYQVDCSFVPYTDFSACHGPDFRGTNDQPFWLDREAGLLEVPLTVGFAGMASAMGPKVQSLFDSSAAARLRLPGILSRTHLVERVRLSPEGFSATELCRLLDAEARRGTRTFSLTYHSPSLEPGHTPYVLDQAELKDFLAKIETVLTYFRDRLGGRFTTLSAVRRRFERERLDAAA